MMGAITLHINAQLCHYHTVNQSACALWTVLPNTFGAALMSMVYTDFKQVVRIKLSRENPVSEIEHMATLFGRLTTNNFAIPVALQGIILLAALPTK